MEQIESPESSLDFLSTLTDNQAHIVLIHLLRANPSLVDEAISIARELVSGIDEGEIADQVCSALSDLDLHQLWEEEGDTHDGNGDPYEHSSDMMKVILDPYCEEMERYLDREMQGEAVAYCQGIIRGVCDYMHDEAGEFADRAADIEDGLTYDVIERWREKSPESDLIRDLVLFRDTCLKRDG